MIKKAISFLVTLILLIGLIGCIDPPAPIPVEGDTYTDPAGRFSVPIPSNWTAAQHVRDYGILTGPDKLIKVYVDAVEAGSMEEGVRAAWKTIDPNFNLDPVDIIEVPAQNGADTAVTITYDTGSEEDVIIAGGWMYKGIAYIEIIKSDLITLQKRISQLQIIDTGFTITALIPSDLSTAEPRPLDAELFQELEAYIVESMDLLDVPGLSIAVVKGDEIIYEKGFGVRMADSDDPVTPQTRMLIGSTTKTMTTMLMAQLIDSGLMDWDTPVVEILPDFSVADPAITQSIIMQNLVCACTGVPRRDFELIFNATQLSAEDIIESLADFEFFTAFGEAFQYSNQMVATGGYVAVLAAGGSYGSLYDDYVDLMQQRIFDPIDMADTTFSFDEAISSNNYALPHANNVMLEYRPISLETEKAFIKPIAPAGGAWSTVLDMGRYLITELNEGISPDGDRVVSAENLSQTWEPQVAITADASYGLGWIVDDYKGLPMLHHGGNTLGFTSDLAFFPSADIGVSILTNQRGSLANEMVRMRLLELMYEQEFEYDTLVQAYLGQLSEQVEEIKSTMQESIDHQVIEPYLGTYVNDVLGDVVIEWQDDRLIFDAGEFAAEIRSFEEEDQAGYGLYDSVFAGLSVEFEGAETNECVFTIGAGVNEYQFEQQWDT